MRIVIVILVVILVGLAVAGIVVGPKLMDGFEGFGSEPDGREVDIAVVERGELIETVKAPGEIEPHTSVQISAEVSAKILELPFDESAAVRRGDLVAKLDDRDLQANLDMARARRDGEAARLKSDRARLAGLQTRLEFARRELERQQQLYESGDVARKVYEDALQAVEDLESDEQATTHSLAVTESSLAAAEADIVRAEDGIEKTLLRSPIDGLITLLNVEAGEVVTGSLNNPGTVLMTIADLNRMVHIAEVAESDVARVGVGQNARLYINAYPDDAFRGTVRQVALQRSGAADGTGHFRTEIEIDLRGQQIPSGLIANAEIEIDRHAGLTVPYQAIVSRKIDDLPERARSSPFIDRSRQFASVVYRIVNGRTVCTPVRTGAIDDTHRLILDGLDEGDEVVTGPFKLLEDLKHDMPVKDRSADTNQDSDTDTDADASPPASASANSPSTAHSSSPALAPSSALSLASAHASSSSPALALAPSSALAPAPAPAPASAPLQT